MNARHTRRSWRVMSAFALLLASASILLSAWLFTRVQNERSTSVVTACVRDSNQSRAIIAFLDELGSRPKTLDKAREFFPVLSREQCEKRARSLVGPPPAKR
jgi:hypothetical protein